MFELFRHPRVSMVIRIVLWFTTVMGGDLVVVERSSRVRTWKQERPTRPVNRFVDLHGRYPTGFV